MIRNKSINFRFDLALTYYRVGELQQCKDILRELDVEVDQLDATFRMPVDEVIKQVARQIEANPAGLAALLDEWEDTNIETLGLEQVADIHRTPKGGSLRPVLRFRSSHHIAASSVANFGNGNGA